MRLKVKERMNCTFLNGRDLPLKNWKRSNCRDLLKNRKRSNCRDLKRPNGMNCAFLNGGDLVLKKWKKSNGGYLRRLKAMECVSFNG